MDTDLFYFRLSVFVTEQWTLEGRAVQSDTSQRPTHAPWWCFGADPVEESDTFLTVEVLLEATESEFTRMFFLPAVTVWLQSENRKKTNNITDVDVILQYVPRLQVSLCYMS